jgi:hypothetical protein
VLERFDPHDFHDEQARRVLSEKELVSGRGEKAGTSREEFAMSGDWMMVDDGRTPIGEICDVGPGKVKAYSFTESGRVSLGSFSTRREAMRAIAVHHPSGTEPPRTASGETAATRCVRANNQWSSPGSAGEAGKV